MLLALADHAHDDGSTAYPGVALLVEKTRLTERAVRYVLRGLEERGSIVNTGVSPRRTTCWQIVMGEGAKIAPLTANVGSKSTHAKGANGGAREGASRAHSLPPNRTEPVHETGKPSRLKTSAKVDDEARELVRRAYGAELAPSIIANFERLATEHERARAIAVYRRDAARSA